MFAVLSVWMGLGALVTTVVVTLLPREGADAVVTLLPYTYALSCTFAAGVLWALRRQPADEPGVTGQRAQAFTAIGLNGLSFAILLFALQSPLHALAGLALEVSFLSVCWWSYRRVVLQE